jgi:hypothetical protein
MVAWVVRDMFVTHLQDGAISCTLVQLWEQQE